MISYQSLHLNENKMGRDCCFSVDGNPLHKMPLNQEPNKTSILEGLMTYSKMCIDFNVGPQESVKVKISNLYVSTALSSLHWSVFVIDYQYKSKPGGSGKYSAHWNIETKESVKQQFLRSHRSLTETPFHNYFFCPFTTFGVKTVAHKMGWDHCDPVQMYGLRWYVWLFRHTTLMFKLAQYGFVKNGSNIIYCV